MPHGGRRRRVSLQADERQAFQLALHFGEVRLAGDYAERRMMRRDGQPMTEQEALERRPSGRAVYADIDAVLAELDREAMASAILGSVLLDPSTDLERARELLAHAHRLEDGETLSWPCPDLNVVDIRLGELWELIGGHDLSPVRPAGRCSARARSVRPYSTRCRARRFHSYSGDAS